MPLSYDYHLLIKIVFSQRNKTIAFSEHPKMKEILDLTNPLTNSSRKASQSKFDAWQGNKNDPTKGHSTDPTKPCTPSMFYTIQFQNYLFLESVCFNLKCYVIFTIRLCRVFKTLNILQLVVHNSFI